MFWSRLLRHRLVLTTMLLGAAAFTTAPASAALDDHRADLTVTMSQSSNQVPTGGQLTYTLTAKNINLIQAGCDVDRHGRPICTPDTMEPGPLSGVDGE